MHFIIIKKVQKMHFTVDKKVQKWYNKVEVNSMELRELREAKNITQLEAANFLNISLRSYKEYENDVEKRKSYKYTYFVESLERYNYIDEDHGIYTIDCIKEIVSSILSNKDVEFCYLFGSYAKKEASSNSDIDLLIASPITGLEFYGLAEELREKLKKKVDIVLLRQLENNIILTTEILKYGIKIYERR